MNTFVFWPPHQNQWRLRLHALAIKLVLFNWLHGPTQLVPENVAATAMRRQRNAHSPEQAPANHPNAAMDVRPISNAAAMAGRFKIRRRRARPRRNHRNFHCQRTPKSSPSSRPLSCAPWLMR